VARDRSTDDSPKGFGVSLDGEIPLRVHRFVLSAAEHPRPQDVEDGLRDREFLTPSALPRHDPARVAECHCDILNSRGRDFRSAQSSPRRELEEGTARSMTDRDERATNLRLEREGLVQDVAAPSNSHQGIALSRRDYGRFGVPQG